MKTTKDNVIIPDIFTEAVKGAFVGMTALWGTGVAIVNDTFTGTKEDVGNQVKVPYFSSIGEFQDVTKDGDPLVPQTISQTSELAEVEHKGLAFEVTQWARASVGGDIYEEGARQSKDAAIRKADDMLIKAAADPNRPGALLKNLFNPASPRTLDWDALVDAKMSWGDEQDPVALLVVHSKVLGDLWKLKLNDGRPLLVEPRDGETLPRIMGIPVGVSDRMPLDGSAMRPVTAAGTTPPAVTLTGTPTGHVSLRVEITAPGALGTAQFRYSSDGGQLWSRSLLTAPSLSLPGTGLVVNFPQAASYAIDNAFASEAEIKHTTLLLKKGSLAFWYNRALLALDTDKDILAHSDVAAMHLYAVVHRYVRMPARRRSGVVIMRHH